MAQAELAEVDEKGVESVLEKRQVQWSEQLKEAAATVP